MKVAEWRPAFVAVLGMDAYRVAFRRPRAMIGEQPQLLSGARIWLLPNPSGLQARYGLPDMVIMFTALRQVAGIPEPARTRPVIRKPRPGVPHGEAR